MRIASRLTIFLFFLPTILLAQEISSDWIDSLGDPRVAELAARIEEEESRLPPLSPLSQPWFDAVESMGEALLRSGVHRSSNRYEAVASYLYERGAWAGLPSERLRKERTGNERLLGTVTDGPEEQVLVAELLGTAQDRVEAGEAGETSALDALRRLEVVLLTSSSLSEKAELAGRARQAMTLLLEMRGGISEEQNWGLFEELFLEAAGAVEAFRVPGDDESVTIGESSELQVGVGETELLPTLRTLDPASVEMALRWDEQVALGAATFFDQYRWSLAPAGDGAELGALLFVLEEKQTELYRELFRRRLREHREELLLRDRHSSAEELREQLLGEATSVLSRYEERARGNDDEAERWALLSVLSHPYAQMVLFQEGEASLRGQLRRRVETLYAEVDTRARDLVSLVARRHGIGEWSYEVTPIPDSFDRIITVRLLPAGEEEVATSLEEQLSEAYYRAFNLVTNPEQNQEVSGQGVAAWSMLHGQYFEPVVVRDGSGPGFRDHLRPWFLQEARAEEARGGFPFAYRGYQRISFAQRDWLRDAREAKPRRMYPRVPAAIHLAAEEVSRFLAGERTLFETEGALSFLLDTELLPPHFAWASALEDARSRYGNVSRAEATAGLLARLELAPEQEQARPRELIQVAALLEAQLRRVQLLRELELLSSDLGEGGIYDAWIESAVPRLVATDRLGDALELPARWREAGLLTSSGAERFYRALSAAGVEALQREEEADE